MSRNLHAEITGRILSRLRAGVVPWRQPWSNYASGAMPRNAVTGRAYSGANVPLLWATAQERGYASPRWLTFKQALEAGGNVRKGETGTVVVFVSAMQREDEESGQAVRIPFLRAFTVFNVGQCDGLGDLEPPPPPALNPEQRDAIADEFMRSTGARIRHGESRAYYSTRGDFINLPIYERFAAASGYYATAFHELTHWTGAESRCNRVYGKRFGDESYSAEELVAELGSAFLCAEFGYDNAELENQSAYIASWIKYLENHEKAFSGAASMASRAVEFMRGQALASDVEATA